jgi:hypothetical protein
MEASASRSQITNKERSGQQREARRHPGLRLAAAAAARNAEDRDHETDERQDQQHRTSKPPHAMKATRPAAPIGDTARRGTKSMPAGTSQQRWKLVE